MPQPHEIDALERRLESDGWTRRDPVPFSEACSSVWIPREGDFSGCPLLVKIYDDNDVELELHGRKSDGVWASLTLYGLGDGELAEVVPSQAREMAKVWELLRG